MFTEEQLNGLTRRVNQRDFSVIADIFSAGIDDDAVLRQASRREAAEKRASEAWSYQPPKTVPVTWVDMCVWLFNKLGIRNKQK